MAKLVFAMNVSLDGYVDYDKFAPDPPLFRHWIEQVQSASASIYGRKLYEIMRYFDEDHPEWDGPVREFAEAWRDLPKWVVSRSLTSIGPNATLIEGDVAAAIRGLKDRLDGVIDIGGPVLAGNFPDLIDEYRLYLHPVVLGSGDPFFTGPLPKLRLAASDRVGGEAIRLTYVPAA